MLSLLASLSATTRPPALSGVFLSAYEQNVAFSPQRWDAELDAMAAGRHPHHHHRRERELDVANYSTPLGERVRVYAFWPTQIGASVPGYEMVDTGHPFVERVLTAADARKISVVLGNADVPWVDQGGNQSWAMQAALSRAIVDELWALYGHHPSVAGFYNAVELSCERGNQALSLQIADAMFAHSPRTSSRCARRCAPSPRRTTGPPTRATRTTIR